MSDISCWKDLQKMASRCTSCGSENIEKWMDSRFGKQVTWIAYWRCLDCGASNQDERSKMKDKRK